MGLINFNIPTIIYNYSEDIGNIQSGIATVLTSSIPIITMLLSRYMNKSGAMNLTLSVMIGILLCIVGVFSICFSVIYNSFNNIKNIYWYLIFYIGVVMQSFAIVWWKNNNSLFIKYYDEHFKNTEIKIPPVISVWYQCFLGMLLGFVGFILIDYNVDQKGYLKHFQDYYAHIFNAKSLVILLWLGIVSSILVALSYYTLMKRTTPFIVSSIYFLQPIVAQLEAIFIFHVWSNENSYLKALEVFGFAIVITGLILCVYK